MRTRADDYDDEWEDDEDDFYLEDEEGPSGHGTSYEEAPSGPAFAPMWTGLLNHKGDPILRHPVAVRVGFHPERNKYYTPTLESDDIPSSGAVVGWYYDA